MPPFGLALAKRAVNQCEDLMGMRPGMDSVFGLHHLAHAHNAEVSGRLAGRARRPRHEEGRRVTGAVRAEVRARRSSTSSRTWRSGWSSPGRCSTRRLAWAQAHGDGWPCNAWPCNAGRDVSAAKVACADAAYRAARAALQVHGAIGYTAEHDLSLWLAKVRALVPAWGSQAEHRARVAGSGRDVSLTGEQQDLRDAVRGLLARGGQADGAVAWRRLCREVGVAGLAIPERYGGAGAGPAETGVVMEELGRDLTCSPMLGSAVLAAQALLASGDDAACGRLLPAIADGSATAALAWTTRAGHWDSGEVACPARAGRRRLGAGRRGALRAGRDTADVLLVAARAAGRPGCSRWTRARGCGPPVAVKAYCVRPPTRWPGPRPR